MVFGALLIAAMSVQANKLPVIYYATGEQLLAACVNDSVALDRGNCWGYLAAFIEVTALLSQHEAINPRFCLGSNGSLAQYQRIVVRHGIAHPEILSQGAAHLVTFALEESFPCL